MDSVCRNLRDVVVISLLLFLLASVEQKAIVCNLNGVREGDGTNTDQLKVNQLLFAVVVVWPFLPFYFKCKQPCLSPRPLLLFFGAMTSLSDDQMTQVHCGKFVMRSLRSAVTKT